MVIEHVPAQSNGVTQLMAVSDFTSLNASNPVVWGVGGFVLAKALSFKSAALIGAAAAAYAWWFKR